MFNAAILRKNVKLTHTQSRLLKEKYVPHRYRGGALQPSGLGGVTILYLGNHTLSNFCFLKSSS